MSRSVRRYAPGPRAARALLAAGVVVAMPAAARAVARSWSSGTGGFFDTGANWSTGVAPGSGDSANFGLAATYAVQWDEITNGSRVVNDLNVTGGNVTLRSTGTTAWLFTVAGTGGSGSVSVTGGSLSIGGVPNPGVLPLTLAVTNDLLVRNAASMTINQGASVTAATLSLADVTGGGDGTMTVNSGTLNVTGAATSSVGGTGTVGSLTLNGAAAIASFSSNLLTIGTASGTVSQTSSVTVNGGAALGAKSITVGGTNTAGSLTLNAGSVTQSGASTLSVGGTSGFGSVLDINGGTYATGTGQTSVDTTGQLKLDGGTLNLNGHVAIAGAFTRTAGTLNWTAGRQMLVTGNGLFSYTGGYALPAGAGIFVSNSAAKFETTGTLTVNAGSGASVTAGTLNAAAFEIGTSGGGTVVIDGSNSKLNTTLAQSVLGGGGTASLTVRSGATATFGGQLQLIGNTGATAATLNVQSGAKLNLNAGLDLGTFNWPGQSSDVNVDGTGTVVTDAGSGPFDIGISSGGPVNRTSKLTVSNDGVYNFDSPWWVNVNPGGTLIANTGRFNPDGDLYLRGGTIAATNLNAALIGSAGPGINLQSGKAFTATSGTATFAQTLLTGDNPIVFTGPQTSLNAGAVLALTLSNKSLTLDNGATATIGALALGTITGFPSAGNGTVNISNGASVTATQTVLVAADSPNANGVLNLGGGGAALRLTGGNMTIGSDAYPTVGQPLDRVNGTVNVGPASSLAVTAGTLTIGRQGLLNIDGGSVSVSGALTSNGKIAFNAGSLSFSGPLPVGAGGLLGGAISLDATRSLTAGATSVASGGTLSVTGGALSVDTLTVNAGGTFNFATGSLAVRSGTFPISSVGPIGRQVSLGADRNLSVSAMTIAPDATLSVDGGRLNASAAVTNDGQLDLSAGFANLQSLTNSSTGRINLSPGRTLDITSVATNNGRITFQPGSRLRSSSLGNSGLLIGSGEVSGAFTNNNTGEVRVQAGDTLLFSSASASTNNGRISLLGGTTEFAANLTNTSTGIISGRGTLAAGGTLTNAGQIQFTSGFSDVYATLVNNSAAKIIVSGGGSATFYKNVTVNAGSELRVSANASATFFAPVSAAAATITGPGAKYFEAGQSVIPSLQSFGSTFVAAPASLSADLIQEQSLAISGAVTLRPGLHATSTLSSLTLDPGATLDLTTNTLQIAGAPDAHPALIALLSIAYSHGAWNLPGITSSSARDNPTHATTLAYADDGTTLTIKYTWLGDLNLDGLVNAADRNLLQTAAALPAGPRTWSTGDLNYDGQLTPDDFALFALGTALSAGGNINTFIPEPSSLAFASLLPFATFPRRARQSHLASRAARP